MLGLAGRSRLCVSQAGQRASGPAPRPTAPALSPPAHPASHAAAQAAAAAAAPAAVAVEQKVELLREAAEGALRRRQATVDLEVAEAMPVPRDWVVLSRIPWRSRPPHSSGRSSSSSSSGRGGRLVALSSPASASSTSASSRATSAGLSSTNGSGALLPRMLPPPEPVHAGGSATAGEGEGSVTFCAHCRYPCHTSGLPACEAAEYLNMWDLDSHLKPAFFDASWAGRLPNCSEMALVTVGGRCNGRWKLQNQDSFFMHAFQPMGAEEPGAAAALGHGSGGAVCSLSPAPLTASVVGVMDGHGSLGAAAARCVRDGMLAALAGAVLPAPPAGASGNGSMGQEEAQALLQHVFARAQERILGDGRDYSKSGATAVLCMVLADRIVAAWAGDSRAVVGEYSGRDSENGGGGWQAHELTHDHKADSPGERERIEAAGGRVTRVTTDAQGNPIGPFRIFLPGNWVPGLAVARAFGDTVASEIGVLPIPEFASFALPPSDSLGSPALSSPHSSSSSAGRQRRHLLIVASDGLFEWVHSQRAVEIAGVAASAEDAAHALVEEAQKKWALQYRGRNCDDISVAVAFI